MRNLITMLAVCLVGGSAFAAPFTLSKAIKCNSEQTECSIQTSRLTIGDRIGFFNNYDQLVAKGVVRSIKGEDRIVKITDKYSRIERNYRVDFVSKSEKYKMIENEDNFRVGGSLGMGGYNISGTTNAYEISGFGAWSNEVWGIQFPKGFSLIGRGTFIIGSRDISRTVDTNEQKETFSMTGFGVLGGAAFEGFRHTAVSLRAEISVGGSYTSAELGDIDLADEDEKEYWDINVNDGFNVLAHAELNILYNGFDKWHPFFGVALTIHGSATGRTLSLGLVRDIN